MTDKRAAALEAMHDLCRALTLASGIIACWAEGTPRENIVDWGRLWEKANKTLPDLQGYLSQPAPLADEVREAVEQARIMQKYIGDMRSLNKRSPDPFSYHDTIETLITAASTPSTGWMPIETAPRDGTEILVFGGELWGEVSDNLGFSGVAKVSTTNGSYFSVSDTDIYSCYVKNPTHWQPLPPTPDTGEG